MADEDPDVESTQEPEGGAPAEGQPSVVDGSFEGTGRGAAAAAPEPPAQAPAAPPAADPASQYLAGLPQGPLTPLLQHLPVPLLRQIAARQISPEEAVARHYGGRRWAGLIQTEGRAKELETQNKGLMTRFEALVKHLTDTLGVELPQELQPQEPAQPPTEVQALTEKVERFMEVQEEQRIDGVVDQVDSYVASDREAILQEEPEYADAEAFVANRLIEHQTNAAREALNLWSLTKDPQALRIFDPAKLQAVIDGRMTEDELVTLTGLDRCFDIVAQTQHRHFEGRTSLSQDLLAVARKIGWLPTREGGAPQPQPVKPNGGGAPPLPPAAPPRRDPNLDKVRRGMNQTPGPARTGAPALDAKTAVERVVAMSDDDFFNMLQESEDPDKMMDSLLRMASAVH